MKCLAAGVGSGSSAALASLGGDSLRFPTFQRDRSALARPGLRDRVEATPLGFVILGGVSWTI